MSSTVTLYTDGACSGNPGPGGWGAVLIMGDQVKDISGADIATTNNRMELTAAIRGLEELKEPVPIDLYTDSKYVLDGITKWIHGWKKNGWKTSDKKPVKNIDLWQQLDVLQNKLPITWYWVKGHDGHVLNERADALARNAIISALISAQS